MSEIGAVDHMIVAFPRTRSAARSRRSSESSWGRERDQAILTPEEFEAKKKQILGV
jgi:hypothetical protein